MRLVIVSVALLAAGASHAAEPKRFGVRAMTALLIADQDVDKQRFKGGDKRDSDGDDLEKNFGIDATFEVPVTGAIRVGGRLGFLRASGDDYDLDHNTFDFGGWARYVFATSAVIQPFAAAGLGATYISADGDVNDADTEASGIGWHLLLGGGVTYAVSPAVDLYGGLHYLHQAAFELEGEVEKTDVTFYDVSYSRFLLVAGAMF